MKHFQTEASLADLGSVKDAVTRLETVLTDILLHGNELPLSDHHYHRLFQAAQALESNMHTLINGVGDAIKQAPQHDSRTEWEEWPQRDNLLIDSATKGAIANATSGPGRQDDFNWNC